MFSLYLNGVTYLGCFVGAIIVMSMKRNFTTWAFVLAFTAWVALIFISGCSVSASYDGSSYDCSDKASEVVAAYQNCLDSITDVSAQKMNACRYDVQALMCKRIEVKSGSN